MLKLLNKLVIPAILVATVMVAGMFAFMPVDQASTVHTDLINSSTGRAIDTFNVSAIDVIDGQEIEISGTGPFCLINLQASFTGLESTDDLGISSINVDDGPEYTDKNGNSLTDSFVEDGNTSDRTVDILAQLDTITFLKQPICANSTIDLILDDAPDGVGDIEAGEFLEIKVVALVQGSNSITVTLGDAD